MEYKRPTKISPAPLPNGGQGGFLKLMGKKSSAVHDAEWKALEAKHEVERQKLKERHTGSNKSSNPKKK
jgi:hypothetical protein